MGGGVGGVGELIANGLTNPEVAGPGSTCRVAFDTHLAHILRKRDFISRTQLATEFVRRKPRSCLTERRTPF